MNECYIIVVVVKVSDKRLAIELSFSAGGVSKNQIAVATTARLFFLTAVAISIATRPFKFSEISVSIATRSFVSSIHSLDFKYVRQICEENKTTLTEKCTTLAIITQVLNGCTIVRLWQKYQVLIYSFQRLSKVTLYP